MGTFGGFGKATGPIQQRVPGDTGPRCRGHPHEVGYRQRGGTAESVEQRFQITRLNQPAVFTRADELTGRAHPIRPDHGSTAGEAFGHDERPSVVSRRNNDDIGFRVNPGELIPLLKTQKAYAFAARRQFRPERRLQFARPHNRERDIREICSHLPERPPQQINTFTRY